MALRDRCIPGKHFSHRLGGVINHIIVAAGRAYLLTICVLLLLFEPRAGPTVARCMLVSLVKCVVAKTYLYTTIIGLPSGGYTSENRRSQRPLKIPCLSQSEWGKSLQLGVIQL